MLNCTRRYSATPEDNQQQSAQSVHKPAIGSAAEGRKQSSADPPPADNPLHKTLKVVLEEMKSYDGDKIRQNLDNGLDLFAAIYKCGVVLGSISDEERKKNLIEETE